MLDEILRETWAFQEILEEGLEKGRRQQLQALVEEDFTDLKSFLDEHTEKLIALPHFETLYLKLARARSAEELQNLVLSALES